jgi:TolB-like protein
VPPELDALGARMLSKDPLRRPADGRAAHAALVGLDVDARGSTAAAEVDTLFPQVPSLTLDARAAASAGPVASSIAVLSFLDMSPERDQGYLCDGIAEELIDALSTVEGLRVAARISSFWFKSTAADARDIGTRLGVDAILEGGVRLAGKRLRVTVQLVDVATGYQRWSHRFEGTLDDVFAIQDEIAGRVVKALRGMLSSRDEEAMRRPGTNIEAYSYYLRARQLDHNMSPAAYASAVQMFDRAIEIDPTYAPAYAGLAEVHCRYFEWSYGDEAVRAAADRASTRALEIAPHLAESHIARGQVLQAFHRHDEARLEFDEAIRIAPNSFDANHLYGRLCFAEPPRSGSRTISHRCSSPSRCAGSAATPNRVHRGAKGSIASSASSGCGRMMRAHSRSAPRRSFTTVNPSARSNGRSEPSRRRPTIRASGPTSLAPTRACA